MTDADHIDVTGLKRCSRVRGERSKQFYACRNRWSWKLSDKTRDPVEFMKKAWGQDIDVITLLACEPQEVNRDWRRFEAQYEVVDCGRSKQRAKSLLESLRLVAMREKQLRRKAKEDVDAEIVEAWQSHIDREKKRRKRMESLIEENGLLGLLDNYDFDDRTEEAVFGEICAWGKAALNKNPDDEDKPLTVSEVLVMMRSRVLNQAANFSPAGFGLRGLDKLVRQHYAEEVVDAINSWITDMREVKRARKKIEDRKATVAKTTAKLAKLGLTAGDGA
jgi:hypothetical protein